MLTGACPWVPLRFRASARCEPIEYNAEPGQPPPDRHASSASIFGKSGFGSPSRCPAGSSSVAEAQAKGGASSPSIGADRAAENGKNGAKSVTSARTVWMQTFNVVPQPAGSSVRWRQGCLRSR